ncbi:hypothetical protein D9619_000190 [Psilocybe cf. subviscida]|uniref:SET domain-containing protein n=1 Tax=Psilocybe cf. subviscida TaxID=2480587 RepID=A0A8H5F2M2_9AGAR|nr:hypothetical protein D9619_000190 [Psilocybe cf. subviscida]
MESTEVQKLKGWLSEHGGGFHPQTRFEVDAAGSGVIATQDLLADQTIVSCPFSLVIDQDVAKTAIGELIGDDALTDSWSARQWISTYIAFHWIVDPADPSVKGSDKLAHARYLATLPPPTLLRTPLHFIPQELEIFPGTNLYGATLDREREWRHEWSVCNDVVSQADAAWGRCYLWEHYLTAATYLSSRAFPSSLLSSTPSLQYDPSTEPVLIPGVDALNHARAQPVSWVVNYPMSSSPSSESGPTIALVLHTPTKAGQALNNNYGPKPNAELILGYGFSLPNNPDDTIVLKLGGAGGGRKFEVGRGSKGVEAVWEEILAQIRQGAGKSPDVDEDAEEHFQEYDDLLDAALMFKDMLRTLQKRLPSDSILDETPGHVRPEVASQRDIVSSLLAWAKEKEREAVQMAQDAGEDVEMESEPCEDDDGQ